MNLRFASLLLLGAASSPALAEPCSLTAEGGPLTHVSYDPFSPVAAMADLRIPLRNDGDDPCEVIVYLAPVDGAALLRSGQSSLHYRDQGSPGTGRVGEFGPYRFRIPGKTSETLTVPLIVEPNQVVPRGTYDGQLMVRAASARGEPLAVALPTLSFSAVVLPRVEMGISGTASSARVQGRMAPPAVDFDMLEAGESERVFVNVWSNSSVTISISSENGGELRRDGRDSRSPVRYQATFDGRTITLSAPHLTQRTPPLSIDGASYELAFTILPGGGQFAGVYRDIVTVTVNEN